MKQFDVPPRFRSGLLGRIKEARRKGDPRKKDFSPTIVPCGDVTFVISRHFGFCYGVENAIEIAHCALNENPDKRVFMLGQMIHNQIVNNDLEDRGMLFLIPQSHLAKPDFSDLTENDIVIIPAFGTTMEQEAALLRTGAQLAKYNTTCPFVEKVWNRSGKLSSEEFTVVIHGKPLHEETLATYSHAAAEGHALIIKDMSEAMEVAAFIEQRRTLDEFSARFSGRMTADFDPERDLMHIGVVNQTTMLASETQAIANCIKSALRERFGEFELNKHFADTRDTLCYATNDNQQATYGLLREGADLAIVVGGYNSSNTSHLVDLCARNMPAYFIKGVEELMDAVQIRHFDYHTKTVLVTSHYLPERRPFKIILTSGASCPDSELEKVMNRILELTMPREQAADFLSRFVGDNFEPGND